MDAAGVSFSKLDLQSIEMLLFMEPCLMSVFQQRGNTTISHTLNFYQFLLLATCFGFGKAIIGQLKIYYVKTGNLSTSH